MTDTNPCPNDQAATPPATRRRGGQPGNRNPVRHGLRASGLPRGCGGIANATDQFRVALERQVQAAKGELTIVDAAFINSATRAERHAQLAARWLRLECDRLTADQRLSYSREVMNASQQRAKAIEKLRLDPASLEALAKARLFQEMYGPRDQPPALPPAVDPPACGAPETSREPSCGESPPETLSVAQAGCDNAETSIGVNNNQECDILDDERGGE